MPHHNTRDSDPQSRLGEWIDALLDYSSQFTWQPFYALKQALREGYGLAELRTDLLAGGVVALVAIPLGMALAIASGVDPQYGLYTVIIAGAITALLGGSRCQVAGPTAAFVVILVPIVQKFGFGGLLTAGFMAGTLLILMGLGRMGRLIEFIPHPVTTGFTTGIAVVIATIQLKDFFGLKLDHLPESYLDRVQALLQARGTWSPAELGVAFATLTILVLWPRINKKVPAPLIALPIATLAVLVASRCFPELRFSTIANRFTTEIGGRAVHGIPSALPAVDWPWNFAGVAGHPFQLSFETLRAIAPSAFAIALLAAIESLLSAVVADGMARTKHDPDSELVALGIANVICPFFGGIAATGAIARTAANIRFGARSPVAAMAHAALVLLATVVLASVISLLPMAALAALLVFVAYNMSDLRHFANIVKVAPKSDVIVLWLCFLLTVLFDMVVGVSVGIVLAAMLFMKRMATLTSGELTLTGEQHGKLTELLPPGTVHYQIAGPLFFGAAERAIEAIEETDESVEIVIFSLEDVPMMDISGLVALETAIADLTETGRRAILYGVRPQPRVVIERAGIGRQSHKCRIVGDLQEAMRVVAEWRAKPSADWSVSTMR